MNKISSKPWYNASGDIYNLIFYQHEIAFIFMKCTLSLFVQTESIKIIKMWIIYPVNWYNLIYYQHEIACTFMKYTLSKNKTTYIGQQPAGNGGIGKSPPIIEYTKENPIINTITNYY